MKKSSVAVALALLSPALLQGCRSGNDENSNDGNRSSSGGGRGGYVGGSGGAYRGYGGGQTASPRGGFGGFGRFFSSGG
jgi:hypothetical protein